MLAYLDLPSGLSGDMLLGCLVDAGWPIEQLRATIARLNLPANEWSVDAKPIRKGPLRATLVQVKAAEGHTHRHLSHIRRIIDAADLPAPVKQSATAVFVRLAEAEAKVHGSTPEKVHFHEVGALDAIIDIVGGVAGLHELGIAGNLYASAVPLGRGWANTQHGQIPLPAPATLELLAAAKAPTCPGPGDGEWVTPTGAALLAELARFSQPLMELTRIGTGAGQRDCPHPNVARLWLGQEMHQGPLVELQTNIDDMSPQLVAAAVEQLFSAGALDAWITPIQMKKGRPGVLLSVLGPAALEPVLADILLRQTTTLGVRTVPLSHRHQARRELRPVQTPYGQVRLKLKWVDQDLVGAAPEYEDCRAAAAAAGVPVQQVHSAATLAAIQLLSGELTAETQSTRRDQELTR